MKIGNLPERSDAVELGKWYFRFELLSCPPNMIHCFKPYLFVAFVKFLDMGDPYKINGRPEKKVGGWRYFVFPWRIYIEITK